MSKDEQKEWIRAVTCLHEKPPKFKAYFRAVKHRYDDFVCDSQRGKLRDLMKTCRLQCTSTRLVWNRECTTMAIFFLSIGDMTLETRHEAS
jgi:hypothetical protein